MKVWSCKIGECDAALLPDGADAPMRAAVESAYRELTGFDAAFNFSGWGAELDESERAVVENREPSEEYHRSWLIQQAAPDLYEALSEIVAAEREAIREWEATGGPPWNDTHPAYHRYCKAIAALSKVSQQQGSPQAKGLQD